MICDRARSRYWKSATLLATAVAFACALLHPRVAAADVLELGPYSVADLTATPGCAPSCLPTDFPVDWGVQRTFSYTLKPGDQVTDIRIDGTWGGVSERSAPVEVYLEGILVATCTALDPCITDVAGRVDWNGGAGFLLSDLGVIASSCEEWGMPLVAMMYARGSGIEDRLDPRLLAHAARVGAELGADVVKTSYTGDPASFATVVDGCPAPVVIAGGPRCDTQKDTLEMVRGAMDAGAMGIAFGRNVFGCTDPSAMVRALCAIILDDASIEDALEALA